MRTRVLLLALLTAVTLAGVRQLLVRIVG